MSRAEKSTELLRGRMSLYKLQRTAAIFIWSILAVGGQHPDWMNPFLVTSPPPVHIMQPAGREIQLPCWKKSKSSPSGEENFKSHDVVWHYKRCGLGFHVTPCQSSSTISWTAICGNGTNPCPATLVINITSEESSGLYRCSVSHRNKTSKHFKVTETYEVDITEMKGSPPEFLEGQPRNVTVREGESAVFQCRVHSKVHPNIYWLRKYDEGTSSNGEIITYMNNTYERLESSGERDLSGEVYLSKLILPRSSEEDCGYYICVAISDGGFEYRGAYLTILTSTPLERSTSDGASSSLPLLFLIPAALALVPLIVWVCCQWKKRCRGSHLSARAGQDPLVIIEPVHHNNNPVPRLHEYTPVSSSGYCNLNECKKNCNHCKHYVPV